MKKQKKSEHSHMKKYYIPIPSSYCNSTFDIPLIQLQLEYTKTG